MLPIFFRKTVACETLNNSNKKSSTSHRQTLRMSLEQKIKLIIKLPSAQAELE